MGVHKVDLFVLDCEGCERDVLWAFYRHASRKEVTVDVWVVEGNDFTAAVEILEGGGEYSLLTCIGTMDAVFIRKDSELWTPALEAMRAVAIDVKCPMFFGVGADVGGHGEL